MTFCKREKKIQPDKNLFLFCNLIFWRIRSQWSQNIQISSQSLSPWITNSWWEGWSWPLAGVEDDRWVERGEFDCQQGWRMTAGWRGVSLTDSRGGGWPLGGEGWVWLSAGVEDDRCLKQVFRAKNLKWGNFFWHIEKEWGLSRDAKWWWQREKKLKNNYVIKDASTKIWCMLCQLLTLFGHIFLFNHVEKISRLYMVTMEREKYAARGK